MRRVALLCATMASLLLGMAVPARAAPVTPATPVLRYELDHQTLALGEPLQLRITREMNAAGATLDSLDLSALQRDFDIVERTQGRDGRQESLSLVLYARHAGRITLPTPGWPGRALQLNVTDGSDTVSRVRWTLGVDPVEPLLRQPTTFTLEACDDGSLLWKRPQLPSVEGLLLRPLGETEIITTREGQRCTAHRWHWALLPTAVGPQRLTLPVLEAGKFGRRLRFAAPALELTAKPLPAWLPGEAAVGPVLIEAEALPALPAQAVLEQPLAWRLRVSGGYSVQTLRSLLALQLKQADARLGLDRYAPQIESLDSPTAAPLHRVTLFVLPHARGVLQLPSLQLPWYDAVGGQLMYARWPAAPLEVVDPARARWRLAGAALLTALAAAALIWWGWQGLGWRLRRWQLLRQLGQAQSPEALCQALLCFGFQAGEAAAPTLRSWQARMVQQCNGDGLPALVDALERARFAPEKGEFPLENTPAVADLALLVQWARTWLRRVKPK